MFEIVKAIHEALGIESTLGFVLFIALAFGSASGVVAWVVDRGYKNTLSEKYVAPIERIARFSVMIPFDTAPHSFPIPRDENPDDPLFRTYTDMFGLASNGTVPEASKEAPANGQISWQAREIPRNEASEFLGKLLQYYVFQLINRLQRDSIVVAVGYAAQAHPKIEPPNGEPYPYDKLSQELADNVFFRPFTNRPTIDEMAWKVKSPIFPRETEIKFIDNAKQGKVIRLQRQSYYTAEFVVEKFLGTGVGQIPKHFVTSQVGTTMQWSFFVTMRYRIEQRV